MSAQRAPQTSRPTRTPARVQGDGSRSSGRVPHASFSRNEGRALRRRRARGRRRYPVGTRSDSVRRRRARLVGDRGGGVLAWSLGTTLRLLGTKSDPALGRRDASRLLARASMMVQQVGGHRTEPVLASVGGAGRPRRRRDARLLVVGLSECWQSEGLRSVRLALAASAGVPTLFYAPRPPPGVSWSLRPTRRRCLGCPPDEITSDEERDTCDRPEQLLPAERVSLVHADPDRIRENRKDEKERSGKGDDESEQTPVHRHSFVMVQTHSCTQGAGIVSFQRRRSTRAKSP